MATFTVRTPEPGVNGTVGSVQFHDGVAHVDDVTQAAELAYFRSAGYLVEADKPASEPADEAPKTRRRTSKEDGQ